MKTVFAAALAAIVAFPLAADEMSGHVLAFDRKEGLLVMTDKTIWQMPPDLAIPADLGAGDRVVIDFESAGESGVTGITSLTRVAVALPTGTDGGS